MNKSKKKGRRCYIPALLEQANRCESGNRPTDRTGTRHRPPEIRKLTTGAAAHNGKPSDFELRVYLGMKVLQGYKMLVFPSSADDEVVEKAKPVVRLEEEASADSLAEAAERRHEEARAAIRDGSPARYL